MKSYEISVRESHGDRTQKIRADRFEPSCGFVLFYQGPDVVAAFNETSLLSVIQLGSSQ